jgi:hypothetical protein
MKPLAQHAAAQSSPAGKLPTRKKRCRQLRCDCGQPAIVVISVRVGCDPQYTVQLPLCAECLKLERELHGNNSE